jgi:uncharacterized protein (DUF1697 family)
MTYVAFLRGVNVGGKGIVSMGSIKEALVAIGLSDVRTYINSGNVIFSTRASNAQRLTSRTTISSAVRPEGKLSTAVSI